MKTRIFLALFLSGLAYLWFVDNIAIRPGDEDTHITREEFFASRTPSVNDFGDAGFSDKSACSVDLFDFHAFLSSIGNSPFYRHEVSYLDTTGDGEPEKVNSIVSLNNGICEIHHFIEKDGRRIWDEHSRINRDHAIKAFGNAETVDELGPYALFYLGLVKSRFTAFAKDNSSVVTHLFHIRSHPLFKAQFGHDADGLLSYGGAFIFKMDDGQKAIYMWDEKEDAFVKIFEELSEILPA